MTQEIAAPKVPPATAVPRPGASAVTSPKVEPRFLITGTVVNSLSKAPVAKAHITMSPMGARRANRRSGQSGIQNLGQANATTDAAGRFEVEAPSAGGWSVTAAARGYHTEAYLEHEGYSTAIMLTATSPAVSIAFPLTPAAAIEGFVLDEAGEPVRNAQISLSRLPSATPEEQHLRPQARGSQRTDDRGHYKFAGLLAGSYEIRVQAQPWYADGGSGFYRGGIGNIAGRISANGADAANGSVASTNASDGPDPLDVVYPTVWYPGVADFAQATPIALRGGETRQADIRLRPVPGFHLRIPSEPPATGEDGQPEFRGPRGNTYLSQILPDGSEAGMPMAMHMDPQGNMEYSGLAPGTYILHRQGQSAAGGASTETVRISANSERIVDLTHSNPATVVAVKVDAEADQSSLQITFRDVDTGRVSFAQLGQSFRAGRGISAAEKGKTEVANGMGSPSGSERTIELPTGRYEVFLNGMADLHLSRIEAAGATAMGRIVTIGGGSPVLTLHVANGRANVTGTARFHGKPDEGAMVLLVPATLGDPVGLNVTRRDQSNTDGSFDITNVLPGAYILVAIDHGWDVNWSDPATLRSYLMHGLPLDLSHGGDHEVAIEAQLP